LLCKRAARFWIKRTNEKKSMAAHQLRGATQRQPDIPRLAWLVRIGVQAHLGAGFAVPTAATNRNREGARSMDRSLRAAMQKPKAARRRADNC
jgi:hypothetical protein